VVKKLGQKSAKVHNGGNPATSTAIQLRQHDDDTKEEQKRV